MNPSRILIVDDEIPVCTVVAAVLKEKGYSTEWAATRKDAYDLFQSFKPHIVLLDVFMPEGSGIEVLRWMFETDPEVKIVMISGLHDLGIAKEAMQLGASEYFVKPLNFTLMQATLDKLHPSA